jgi:hypothetical protein
MLIIVQEGEASVSLSVPIQAPDDSLRNTTISSFVGPIKAYYRDYQLAHIEAREGMLELCSSVVGAITWLEKGRRYQLKTSE